MCLYYAIRYYNFVNNGVFYLRNREDINFCIIIDYWCTKIPSEQPIFLQYY